MALQDLTPYVHWELVGGRDKLGVRFGASYLREVIYQTGVFRKRNFFAHEETASEPNPIWPAELVARKKFPAVPHQAFDYQHKDNACPESEAWIRESLLIRFHDGHTTDHADAVGQALNDAISELI